MEKIRLICLAMADEYIDAHFDKIRSYASAIEIRVDDSCCSIDSVKKDNADFIRRFSASGEEIVVIDDDYEMVIDGIVEKCGEMINCKLNKDDVTICGRSN